MYIYIPLCRYWIALYRYVLVFIVLHVDIELEDNKQFISNIPRMYRFFPAHYLETRVQLTTDHVLCLGTLNTEQTPIWKPQKLTFFLCVCFFSSTSASFQEVAKNTYIYLPLKLWTYNINWCACHSEIRKCWKMCSLTFRVAECQSICLWHVDNFFIYQTHNKQSLWPIKFAYGMYTFG